MGLHRQIASDWKAALLARDAKKDVLSLMNTELKNRAINDRSGGASGTEVGDEVALEVLAKMAKQRKESIESFKKAGREDLANKESNELEVIQNYLPKQLSQEDVQRLVSDVIADQGATSMKDMGRVMSECMKRAKGRVDGKVISQAVKSTLG